MRGKEWEKKIAFGCKTAFERESRAGKDILSMLKSFRNEMRGEFIKSADVPISKMFASNHRVPSKAPGSMVYLLLLKKGLNRKKNEKRSEQKKEPTSPPVSG